MKLEEARGILRAIVATGDPRIKATEIQVKALGLQKRMDLCEGMRCAKIDAAEVIGCRAEDLDLSRAHHVKVITDVVIQMMLEEIAAAPGSRESSQSCYLQKAP